MIKEKDDFPCAIGQKVYFVFDDTDTVEEDVVIGFKGMGNNIYVLLKENGMITMSSFAKHVCYTMEQVLKSRK